MYNPAFGYGAVPPGYQQMPSVHPMYRDPAIELRAQLIAAQTKITGLERDNN
ncbi:hypothetical protein KIPB_010816, partial [Kipferlia bialata]|eukprot:g10816.t1